MVEFARRAIHEALFEDDSQKIRRFVRCAFKRKQS
jgi:hypothetical protein